MTSGCTVGGMDAGGLSDRELLAMIREWEASAGKRWFLTAPAGGEREVTQAEFIQAERRCGFFPTLDPGGEATGGFIGADGTRGRITYDRIDAP